MKFRVDLKKFFQMHIIIFDDESREDLLPLTFLRPVSEIRVGILTMRERWERLLQVPMTYWLTQRYLRKKFPYVVTEKNLFLNGKVVATHEIADFVKILKPGEVLTKDSLIIAFCLSSEQIARLHPEDYDFVCADIICDLKVQSYDGSVLTIERPWHIFQYNEQIIKHDFDLITTGRESAKLSETNTLIGSKDLVFIEHGARIECTILNTQGGPIYIGKEAELMELSCLRGPLAVCEHAVTKMGSKIYGATTIGPYCKIGGEVSNTVFFGFSNKAHEGYIGDSVIAEWCNLGADTNTSNLKNTYDEVKLWSYREKKFINTGLQFCGTIMADHSKTGINTMLNTGTVIGVSSNIFGSGYPRQFIPSFSWGGASGFTKYELNKALETARKVCARRNVILSDIDAEILEYIHKMS